MQSQDRDKRSIGLSKTQPFVRRSVSRILRPWHLLISVSKTPRTLSLEKVRGRLAPLSIQAIIMPSPASVIFGLLFFATLCLFSFTFPGSVYANEFSSQ